MTKKRVVKVVLANWRRMIAIGNSRYAQAYLMGAWTAFSDKQSVTFLSALTKEEFEILIDYPIWM